MQREAPARALSTTAIAAVVMTIEVPAGVAMVTPKTSTTSAV